jgi:hypothetical protein
MPCHTIQYRAMHFYTSKYNERQCNIIKNAIVKDNTMAYSTVMQCDATQCNNVNTIYCKKKPDMGPKEQGNETLHNSIDYTTIRN